MSLKLFKKTKKAAERELLKEIDEKVKKEHKRIIDLMSKAEPGTGEYAKLMGQLKELEAIQNQKDKIQNEKDDSKRGQLLKTLITAAANIGIFVGFCLIELVVPVNSKILMQYLQKLIIMK